MMNPIKVLHVETGKTWRGSQRQVLYTLVGLKARGHIPLLACPPGVPLASKAKEAGIQVHEIPMHGELDLWATLKLFRLMRKERPQIVHLQSAHAHIMGGLAARLAKIPVVLSRRLDYPVNTNIFKRIKYQHLYDKIIVISRAVEDILVQSGINPDLVTLVYSVIKVEDFEPKSDGNKIRAELNLGDHTPLVGVVARLEERKGHRYLFEAIPQILNHLPDAKFLVAGQGPLAAQLQQLTQRLGIMRSVIFMGFRTDIPEILSAIDLLVLPSVMEGLGVCLLEAMAAKLPIVATAAGGIPEVVEDGVNGILVPPKDPLTLAEAIIKLLTHKELAKRMGEAGRKMVEAKFSLDKMVEDTLQVYQQLLKEKRLI